MNITTILTRKQDTQLNYLFGQLKKQIFCLGSTIRIKLDRIPSEITACACSHNMAKILQYPDISLMDDVIELSDSDILSFIDDPDVPVGQSDRYDRHMGEAKRIYFLQINRTS